MSADSVSAAAGLLLITWNVNSLKVRLPRLLELLAQHRPDVVCLQETKCAPEAFPEAELKEAGYLAAHHSAGRWAGVALLARMPLGLTDVERGLPGEAAPEEARWIEATVAGVRVASVYVPNGRSPDSPEFPRKLQFLRAMGGRAAELEAAGSSVLIAGDMNVAPADADVYDPALFVDSTHTSEPERSLLAEIPMTDAFRHLHHDGPGYTWWDYRAGHFHQGLGLRIDLVLTSSALTDRLAECGIDRNFRKGHKPSDHAPLLARFGSPPA